MSDLSGTHGTDIMMAEGAVHLPPAVLHALADFDPEFEDHIGADLPEDCRTGVWNQGLEEAPTRGGITLSVDRCLHR